jgi:hypothetical protein
MFFWKMNYKDSKKIIKIKQWSKGAHVALNSMVGPTYCNLDYLGHLGLLGRYLVNLG